MFSFDIQSRRGAFQLHATFSSARESGVIALTGVSGSGKSSVLHCIAGLRTPDSGVIQVAGRTLYSAEHRIDLPAHQRQVGVVFQDSRLFPHMTVRRNLEFGVPVGRPRTIALDTVIALLDIAHLLERRPGALSGGERQRVAIGRALLTSPAMLLMDEPLASLDQARKDEVLPFLAALPRRLDVPILYVTHSVDEVLQLADELVVMASGRVVDAGPVAETICALVETAGVDNILEGIKADSADGVHVGPFVLRFLGSAQLTPGARVRMRVSADDVILSTGSGHGLSVRNRLPCRIRTLEPRGGGVLVTLALDGAQTATLRAMVTDAAVEELHLQAGQPVVALIKAASVRAPGAAAL